jgi:hypothetical protein
MSTTIYDQNNKINKINISLLLTTILILTPVIFNFTYDLRAFKEGEESNSPSKKLRIAQISDPIIINNNWSDAEIAGICTGSGTWSNPYVIEDLIIDGKNSSNCILIQNSNEFFRIENCILYNSSSAFFTGGIKLNNVKMAQYITITAHIIIEMAYILLLLRTILFQIIILVMIPLLELN